MRRVGLRVDVDTLRGTRTGVPKLIALFERHKIKATFFFSVGPDNMGRHLWRLLKPRFLAKMLRTRAASLYGWDILLRGTFYSGPNIAKQCTKQIRMTADAGYEIGLHAWDHHRWQRRIAHMDQPAILKEIQKGWQTMNTILGSPPAAFAAPAWRVTPDALDVLERFPFRFLSDCRGHSLFHPLVIGRQYRHIQVPTTLPTYDESIGLTCTLQDYNQYLLSLILPDQLNVLAVHAEVEGIAYFDMFGDFIDKAIRNNIQFETLGDITDRESKIRVSSIYQGEIPGREGWLAIQE